MITFGISSEYGFVGKQWKNARISISVDWWFEILDEKWFNGKSVKRGALKHLLCEFQERKWEIIENSRL